MKANEITQWARPLAVKILTRAAVWLLTAKLGYSAIEAQTTGGQIGNAAGALACLILGVVIDRWHHRADRAELPEA